MAIQTVAWIYVLDRDYIYNIAKHLPPLFNLSDGCAFEDANGKRWLEIHPNGCAVVKAGYAWDGCTPKFSLWDILVGTPDGVPHPITQKPKAYYASLLHDAFYQFLDAGLPLTRATVDAIFLEILTRDGFAPRQFYYQSVRYFGGLFRLIRGMQGRYGGRKVQLYTGL